MTTYYVDAVNGSDSNNGLGPDASNATNKPWQTIGKLLGSSGMSSGDIGYLSPAGPFRERVSIGMASATVETIVDGDESNAQGFKDASGNLVTPGIVEFNAYTNAGGDTGGTSTSISLLTVPAERDFLTFRNIYFVGSAASQSIINAGLFLAQNWTFEDCIFQPGHNGNEHVKFLATVDLPLNLTFRRCRWGFAPSGSSLFITAPTTTNSDYNLNILIENCAFYGAQIGINLTTSGTNTGKPGGATIQNCDFLGSSNFVQTSSRSSTTLPANVYACKIESNGTALLGGAAGTIVEDYNYIYANSARSNVTAGANSQAYSSGMTIAPKFFLGQALAAGVKLQPFLTPMTALLGFGTQSGAPTTDITGRNRPEGGGSTLNAVGAYERHDTAVTDTSPPSGLTNTDGSLRFDGPGSHELTVPVDTTSTTISFKVRYDSNYTGTNYPRLVLVNGKQVGVSDQTVTATSAANGAWYTISLSAFTATSKGEVTVRLVSRSGGATGKCWFGDYTIS